MYSILIVDDEPLVQAGIKSMLNCMDLGLEICGVAANGETALQIIENSSPDIVICDIKMPIMSGLELIKICCGRYGYHKPVFIFLTSYEEFSMAKEALTYQASDYLIKLELTPELLNGAMKKAIERIPASSTSSAHSETDAPNYNEKFYIRLLQNMFDSPEQYRLQSEYLKISFDADAYLCVYIEFFDRTCNNLSPGQQFSLYTSSFNMLNELIVKYLPAKVIPLDIKHCAIIIEISFRENQDSPDTPQITDILGEMQNSLKKYYNTLIRAGIGSVVTDPLELSQSYQYARQAYSFTDDEHAFLSIDDCQVTDYNHQTFNLSLFRSQFQTAFEEFDEECLKTTISQLTDMFRQYPKRNFQALDAACSILYMAISSLPNGEQTLAQLFDDFPDCYRSIYRQHTMEQIITWLNVFCDKLSRYFVERKSTHTNHTVNLVKRYISEHICDRLSLNDIAFRFNITPNYLSQLFKKYNDSGFTEYVTCMKINEAKKMMADGSMKIYEISDKLGFESSFYFSKVFKKYEGISPKEYMNQKIEV